MRTTILVTALWAIAVPTGGADTLAYPRAVADPQPESRVWITGSSTIRHFTCRAQNVTGSVDLRANLTRRPVLSGQNLSNAASLRIPVAALDCGNAKMNRDLRVALRAVTYENIEFHLDSYDVQFTGAAPTARVSGRLRIAGTERPLVLMANVDCDALGNLHVRGIHVLRMTDFGVRPPRRFAGLLRVRDRIAVHFDVVPDRSAGLADIVQRTPGEPAVPHYPGGRYGSAF
jgi:polyisoprenoid-binding protein YceI